MVLIPTAGRARLLARALRGRMAHLDHEAVVFATHVDQFRDYQECIRLTPRAHWYMVANPTGSVAVMREALRQVAVIDHGVDWFVVTDDNAVFTDTALHNLVECARCYPHQPATVAGMHQTAAHFDRRLIATTRKSFGGMDSYANVSMMFQVYPRSLYEEYSYPPDAYGLDDRHFYLWAVNRGVQHFRVCMSAPFNKSRYQEGGQGSIVDRAKKNGLAIARLATDFPELVGAAGTLRIPWQLILGMRAGVTPNRLAGGAMRTESRMLTKHLTARVRHGR